MVLFFVDKGRRMSWNEEEPASRLVSVAGSAFGPEVVTPQARRFLCRGGPPRLVPIIGAIATCVLVSPELAFIFDLRRPRATIVTALVQQLQLV